MEQTFILFVFIHIESMLCVCVCLCTSSLMCILHSAQQLKSWIRPNTAGTKWGNGTVRVPVLHTSNCCYPGSMLGRKIPEHRRKQVEETLAPHQTGRGLERRGRHNGCLISKYDRIGSVIWSSRRPQQSYQYLVWLECYAPPTGPWWQQMSVTTTTGVWLRAGKKYISIKCSHEPSSTPNKNYWLYNRL